MRVRHWLPGLGTLAVLAACGTEQTAVDAAPTAAALRVEAVGVSSVSISWDRVNAANVTGYELQRREDLNGPFRPVGGSIPQAAGRITVFDNEVKPETYYGYRVLTLTTLGGRSGPSTVGGARTPSLPTLVVTVTTTAPNDGSMDPDGYVATVLGPRDTVTTSIGTNGQRRLGALRAGNYLVVLRGLARNCDFQTGDSLRTAVVTDIGLETETSVRFDVSCRDPRRGSVVIRYEQDGDTTDADGVGLSVTGLLTEPDPVDTTRVFVRTERIQTRIATYRYDNLRGGQYEVTLSDIAAVCNVIGNRRRTVTVKALSLDTLRFNASCSRPQQLPDTVGKPVVLEHVWSADAAPTGTKVSLTTTFDGTRLPTTSFQGVSFDVGYSPTVLRFDSVRKADIGTLTSNGRSNPGLVLMAGLETDPGGFSGRIVLGRIWFTVIGATGTSTRTGTVLKSLRPVGVGSPEEVSKLRAREATFTVGTFTTQNVPPVARANGPYAATAGVAIRLSAIGSTDPDGRVTAWQWDFGDGTPRVNGETVDHVYENAGTFTASVTVTDDKGATHTDQARVTVTNSGAPNVAPTARISAPASATVNSSVTFSGTQSTDPDGTIQSYAWAFGDGTISSGPTVAKVYSAPGTYNATLTVTDNRNARSTASHVITITAANPGTTPFSWNATFSAVDQVNQSVDLTLTLDLSADIPETPGPEELSSFLVDSLKWDPVILRLDAFNFGPGQQQTVDQSDIARGKVRFSGGTAPGQNRGVLTIARLRFKVLGGLGARATTFTALGPLVGTPATGSFNYRPKTDVREASFVNGPPVQTGTILGAVTSPQKGNIQGATITVSGGLSATTAANGSYSVANVPSGSRTVTVSGLPSDCTAPPAQSVTVTGGGVHTVNFAVTCTPPPPTGTVTGLVTSSLGGVIAGATVTIAPNTTTTDSTGRYTIAGAPSPTGSIQVTAGGCTSRTVIYNGLVANDTLTQDVLLTCQPTGGATYPFTLTWGNITNTGPTGRQVTAIFAIDMGPAPGRPDVNGSGADELVALNWTLQYASTALAYRSRTILASNLDLIAVGNPSPGLTNLAQTSSQNLTDSGNIQLVRVTFDIVSGFSGTVTPTITLNQARAGSFSAAVNVDSSVRIGTVPTLTVP
ncbi:MAG: PKD domain-containing protein [Gemmatimonadetes bacterium]|nr:PKD domain-containing protein [Gemmatimonadota bacterium]